MEISASPAKLTAINKYQGGYKAKTFTEEQKRKAVKEMVLGNRSQKEVAKQFGVSTSTLRSWSKEYDFSMTTPANGDKHIGAIVPIRQLEKLAAAGQINLSEVKLVQY